MRHDLRIYACLMGVLAVGVDGTCLGQQEAKTEQDGKPTDDVLQFYVGVDGVNHAQYSINVYLKPRDSADLKDTGLNFRGGQPFVPAVVPLPVLGLRLERIPAPLKSQLKTLGDRGLLVTGFQDDPGAGSTSSPSPNSPITTFPYLLDATWTKQNLQKKFHLHDILMSVDGQPVTSEEQILSHLLKAGRKKELSFEVLRNGKTVAVALRTEESILPSRREQLLAPLSRTEEKFQIGVQLSEVDEVTRKNLKSLPEKQGVVIESIAPGSAAEAAGLRQYDIILAVDGQPVGDAQTLVKLLQAAGGKKVKLLFLREGQNTVIELTPQSTKQFEVTKVDVTRQGLENAGMPWTVNLADPPTFYRLHGLRLKGNVHVLDADATDDVLETTLTGQPDATSQAAIQSEIHGIREAIGTLTHAIERLEQRLNDKYQAQPPEETNKTGSAEQKKASEQPANEPPTKK